MRCHVLSDLHLESQNFDEPLPGGDVLIIAGDLCQATCLDPSRRDKYSSVQRSRVLNFLDVARARFAQVLFVAGNHEHYDGAYSDTHALLRRHLPGIKILEDEVAEIGGMRFFGSTLWTDFDSRSKTAMDGVRRRVGDFFFIKMRNGEGALRRFAPEDALAAHEVALASLRQAIAGSAGRPTVVITHHAPSHRGLSPLFAGNGLDSAYASDLDDFIESLEAVPVWVHGHTHIARRYLIGRTRVISNALGFACRGQAARGFTVKASFDV